MTPRFTEAGPGDVPLSVLEPATLDEWVAGQPARIAAWVRATGFAAGAGETCLCPDTDGGIAAVLCGLGDAGARARARFTVARAAAVLPSGSYMLTEGLDPRDRDEAALGWLLAGYRFDRYNAAPPAAAHLVAPEGVDAARLEAIAAGEFLTRDLINTPASDLGPDALEAAFRALGAAHGAEVAVISGDDLLAANFPMIHAVGRASDQAPRLLDLRWGRDGDPTLTLVGKGVCFDTGGLNIKPAASMGLMKKDMGGAATVMGLAQTIMELGLRLRLRVLVPAVENSISAGAFRPQDILTSRKGLTVEINNTDAEGRLVLADALALADEEAPDCLICMATLTGAARVALGPDLPPFYTDDDTLADALARAADRVRDPLWRMPLFAPYETMIEPGIADLDNAPKGGFAGSITAALFLRRFVERTSRFVHFDIYGWRPEAAPGRPKGGTGQGARAILDALPEILKS
ncbi:leucyl aminopeptidase [Maritimibacter sp. 55A14]|uniref:leucyl aminopeptidase family protein n=1 Tax=Maritimibacter sp. 55A14 TaxID=2174844 RepID=UPI000D60FF7C|nr:leucyl aminopeptidase family protein [Maritimibacter sp. 55A14]PWE33516.1 leucyl aminopeptidase [Maritimibacter sp. 55A14]